MALGVYFAALLEYWLRFCPIFRVENFQTGTQIVSSSKQTVGQLKFLFRLTQDEQPPQDLHVESSVKFFLLHPLQEEEDTSTQAQAQGSATGESLADLDQSFPLEQFVGPHLGENLAWRVQEVARKLAMCRGESVQSWLRTNYSDNVVSHMVLRGYLFYPLQHFASTSQVTQAHDWLFHRNTTCTGDDASVGRTRPNPEVAEDHLRGWWTSDIENDFQQRVLANPRHEIGESRFVVLPKLHWLSPVIAEEDRVTGHVMVRGEDELAIENVDTMTLAEMVAYSHNHFKTLGPSRAAKEKGGVVMPLLIAEIVRCRPQDVEYDGDQLRWKELSRGFLLDPEYWDPLPLCREAVRFWRTSNRHDDDLPSERQYHGRRSWNQDGVIKSAEDEPPVLVGHSFENIDTITPHEVCRELIGIMALEQKSSFSHANLKQSIKEVLQRQREGQSWSLPQDTFVLDCLRFLVFEHNEILVEESGEPIGVKTLQRVGHIVLDSLEALLRSAWSDSPIQHSPFLLLILQVAKDDQRWEYLNLTLRASGLINRFARMEDGENDIEITAQLRSECKRLLALRQRRWNGIALEILRVCRLSQDDSMASIDQAWNEMLDILMEQEDWSTAEQLASVSGDLALIDQLLSRVSERSMTKAVKRLTKVRAQLVLSSSGHTAEAHSSMLATTNIDHMQNRDITARFKRVLQWEYVDSAEKIMAIVQRLVELEDRICSAEDPHELQQLLVVGLDCEWRPQFLLKEATSVDDKAAVGEQADMDIPTELDDGLSVYQLAVGDQVYVIDVQALGSAAGAPLKILWRAQSPFIVLGFCVSSDVQRLQQSFPRLFEDNANEDANPLLIELKQFAIYRQVPTSTWGLSRLALVCLGDSVDKEQQCSDWGLRPLTNEQLEYAAKDAFAVRSIALHLLADVESASTIASVVSYVSPFAISLKRKTNSMGGLIARDGVVTGLEPLGQGHVRAALHDLELDIEFHRLTDHGCVELDHGLVVKTIAVVIRDAEGNEEKYAAVVLRLDRSIDMRLLAEFFNVPKKQLVLADQEV